MRLGLVIEMERRIAASVKVVEIDIRRLLKQICQTVQNTYRRRALALRRKIDSIYILVVDKFSIFDVDRRRFFHIAVVFLNVETARLS